MPKRIQRKRTKGWKMPDGAVYVGRPTKWGNPYSVSPNSKLDAYSRCSAVEFYKVHLERNPALAQAVRDELKGKDLAWVTQGYNVKNYYVAPLYFVPTIRLYLKTYQSRQRTGWASAI